MSADLAPVELRFEYVDVDVDEHEHEHESERTTEPSKRRARVELALARLKDWRVLRDHRRRGCHVDNTLRAVAVLHNIKGD